MKKRNKTPPVFNEFGSPNFKRFLIRDLDEHECSDWVADVCPELKTVSCDGFPFRLARRWNLGEQLAAITESTKETQTSMPDALARWSEQQSSILSQQNGQPLKLVPIDRLHFDLKQRVWWKTEDPPRLRRLFRALREPGESSWSNLMMELIAFDRECYQYLNSLRARDPVSGLPMDPQPGDSEPGSRCASLISRLQAGGQRTHKGLWSIQHALMPMLDFKVALGLDKRTEETAYEVTGYDLPGKTPMAHTVLVRPRHEWVAPLLERTTWLDDEIVVRVQELSAAMEDAGLRPITAQPPPVVDWMLPLQCFASLVGNRWMDPEKTRLLVGAGIATLDDLLSTPPRQLVKHAPITPSDLRGYIRAVAAFHGSYPYREHDLVDFIPPARQPLGKRSPS
jgi:hypothetical protein